MLVNGHIILEPADHAELGKLLLKKVRKEGIDLRQTVLFPVSAGSVLALSSLISADELSEIAGAIWMPGDNKPPVTADTKAILLVDAVVVKGYAGVKQAKKVLEFLLKRFKLEKKLKGIKLYAACWLSDSEFLDAGDGIILLPAVYAPDAPHVLYPWQGAKKTEGTRQLAFSDAVKQLKWDVDKAYKERHEVVLDKLKNELWG